MITPLEIDHVTLQVSNLNKTMAYLKSIFDFEFVPNSRSNKMVGIESQKIHFFIEESELPQTYLSKQHISFEVDDLNFIKEILKKLHIEYTNGTFSSFKYKNYHWVEWRDHDGIRLECVQRA